MNDPLAEWDYDLPPERVPSRPPAARDGGRLLVVEPGRPFVDDEILGFSQWVRAGDVVVVNDTRVMAARVRARRETGARVEVLVLSPGPGEVPALMRPTRRVAVGERLAVERDGAPTGVTCEVVARVDDGSVRVRFSDPVVDVLEAFGEMPLPPYLGRPGDAEDRVRYQTVFAGPLGAAAAPTAGLHFTDRVLSSIEARGASVVRLTLHVGIGTFRPLSAADLDRGALHTEPYVIGEGVVDAIRGARAAGGRVIAIGTTSARALESATPSGDRVPVAGASSTDLLIAPPYAWRCVDALFTNFHLPRSSLLMLVAARIGRERMFEAYRHAIERGYGFYSYGDAMLLL